MKIIELHYRYFVHVSKFKIYFFENFREKMKKITYAAYFYYSCFPFSCNMNRKVKEE